METQYVWKFYYGFRAEMQNCNFRPWIRGIFYILRIFKLQLDLHCNTLLVEIFRIGGKQIWLRKKVVILVIFSLIFGILRVFHKMLVIFRTLGKNRRNLKIILKYIKVDVVIYNVISNYIFGNLISVDFHNWNFAMYFQYKIYKIGILLCKIFGDFQQ